MTGSTRRRFRWSLRTMFVVVTVICVWIGYYANWIRARHAMLAEPDTIADFGSASQDDLFARESVDAPLMLRLFGERGVAWMRMRLDERRLVRAQQLFPEAEISTCPPRPTH